MQIEAEQKLVTRALSLCVQQKTFAQEDAAVFRRLHTILSELFPHVFSGQAQVVDERALLIRIAGGRQARPLLFLSHLDVVPARFEHKWEYPPFSGAVRDGFVYGRGTLDMKGHLCALLTAAESLLSDGWRPKGDIYFAFSADEEVRGGTMRALCDLLRAQGVSPAFVLDEGGCVTRYTRYHKTPAALIGVAEKGHVCFSMTTEADVGAERLLRAGVKVAQIHFKPHMTDVVAGTLEALAPTASGFFGLVSRHLGARFFRAGALRLLSSSRSGHVSVKSQIALQNLSGDALGYEAPKLTYYVSLLHGDEAQAFIKRLTRELSGDGVTISLELVEEPSCVSPAKGPAWEALKTAVNVHFPHTEVAPYLLPGGSDARRMENICPYVYRFSPFILPPEELKRIHHMDERITVENLTRGVQFFKQILQA